MTEERVITVGIETPTANSVGALLQGSEAFALERYPADQTYLLPLSDLQAANVTVWVARVDGAAAGMVAAVEHHEWVEVKRLFVDETARGLGLGRRLMEAVHAWARGRDVSTVRLETGPLNDAALHLYASMGYERTGPFGSYRCLPTSVFFALTVE